MGKPKIRSRRKQDKPKAVSSITSQYNFRRRDRCSKSFIQKATSKQKDEPSIKDTGLCSTKTIPGITDIQALTGHGSSGLSNEELLDSFSDSLRDTRAAIVQDLELSLAKEEEGALDLLMKGYSSAQQSLALASVGFKGQGRTAHSELVAPSGDSLTLLRDELETSQHQLDSLWKEWGKVQQKLVSLGLEVLGPTQFTSLEDKLHSSFRKKLDAAKSLYQENEGMKEDLQRTLDKDIDQIKNLSKKSMAKSKAQAKAWRVEKRKYWETMRDLAQKLVSQS